MSEEPLTDRISTADPEEAEPGGAPEEVEEPEEPADYLQGKVGEAEAAYRRAVAWQRRATAEVTRTEFELRQTTQR